MHMQQSLLITLVISVTHNSNNMDEALKAFEALEECFRHKGSTFFVSCR